MVFLQFIEDRLVIEPLPDCQIGDVMQIQDRIGCNLTTRDPPDVRAYVVAAGHLYFGAGAVHIMSLGLPLSTAECAYKLTDVKLPEWASDIGVGVPPRIVIDPCCIVPGDGSDFERCDWLRAAYLHISGWLERSVEATSGPIHSYAFRLPREWMQAYDHAWVNRIFLLLRRLAARRLGRDETELFGPRPRARFFLSHDVDALTKTPQIILKSTAMSTIATLRHLLGGRFRSAITRIKDAVRFASSRSDYWLFDKVCSAESKRNFRSIFMFADNSVNSGAVAWLIDPSYSSTEPSVAALIRKLHEGGWQVGIHPGFNTWADPVCLERTRTQVTTALGSSVTLCRQHWLRFSWNDTWAAQSEAGIRLDFTLGFNDRCGFRNGAALRHRPWNHKAGRPHDLESIPTIFMDSHFYDYAFPSNLATAIAPWIDELSAVGGEASFLWHIHTMHEDFGWGPGYITLLDLLVDRGANVAQAHVDE